MLSHSSDKKGGTASPVSGDELIPAAISDTGCERELNEDRYAVIECPSGLAWLVCDGMGGATGGELAAQLALDAMRRDLENLPPRTSEAALKSAILEANRVIVLRRQNQAFSGMGTTLVAALFVGKEISIGHVGDSRAYLIRDGAIQQLTVDHTYVQELVDRGQIKPEEALSHPQAHILTRCIGSEPGLEVSFKKFWIWPHRENDPQDFMMLCTDGLYSLVTEGEIANIISQNSPQRACVQLVELAKARGGYDNITLSIIPIGGQLKNEPPEGYQPPRLGTADVAARQQARFAGAATQRSRFGGPLRSILTIVALSVLSALVTIAVFLFGFLK